MNKSPDLRIDACIDYACPSGNGITQLIRQARTEGVWVFRDRHLPSLQLYKRLQQNFCTWRTWLALISSSLTLWKRRFASSLQLSHKAIRLQKTSSKLGVFQEYDHYDHHKHLHILQKNADYQDLDMKTLITLLRTDLRTTDCCQHKNV